MDGKDVKAALKEAREAIKLKDYKTAQKLCKNVLKSDRNNYLALVLFGVSLQETDQKSQAPNAFKKAIEVSPDQILAWQGLSAYYEKVDEESAYKELVDIYNKIISLESDINKRVEVSKKLAQVALKLNDLDLCIETISSLKSSSELSKEEEQTINGLIVSTLTKLKDVPSKYYSVLEESLGGMLSMRPTIENEENFKKYLKLLNKNRSLDKLLVEAQKMHSVFNNLPYPLEWICRTYYESFLDEQELSFNEDEAELYCSKLLSLNPESSMGLMAKGALLYKRKKFVDACDFLKKAMPLIPNSYYSLGLLGISYLSLNNLEDATFFLRECLKKFSASSDATRKKGTELFLKQSLAKALSLHLDAETAQEALPLCHELLHEDDKNYAVHLIMGRAFVAMGNEKDAKEIIQKLKNIENLKVDVSVLESLILKSKGNLEEAHKILNEASSHQDCTSEVWTELGKLQWELKEFDQCLFSFLKAAKLDPSSSIPFVLLGKFYFTIGKNKDKARRCYMKAFQLNPHSVEAGKGLSDAYRSLGCLEANLELLTSVTSSSTAGASSKWAWLRLGLQHLGQDNHNEAIKCFQSAIRTDPADRHCWESLADAYLSRGSYLTALKSYLRVSELDPSAVYPAFQVASIKQVLGEYEESLIDFQNLLKSNPNYVPALKGTGETCLCLARVYFAQQLIGMSRDMCEEALLHLTRAARQESDFACIWKLMGDACSLMSKLPDAVCQLKIHRQLIDADANENEFKTVNKLTILELGARCYCQALSISPNNSLLWHDLSLNYHYQADHVAKRRLKRNFRSLSLDAAKKAISLDPGNSSHWNLIGIIAASNEIRNFKLAQHSFSMSIKAEEINEVAWTNLGTLYLTLGELRLAHEAFAKAQRTEPAYPRCWIGQALIAESISPEKAMDLFRHTTQLGVHPESCIGYAHWVCSVLDEVEKDKEARKKHNYIYSIVKMHAIPVATDCLMWYTGVVHDNPCAFNMIGLLLERQGLYIEARKAFQKGVLLLENAENAELLDIIRNNYARSLIYIGEYNEAINQYLAIKEPDYVTQCGLAHAYLKGERYEDSYAAYETALKWMVNLPDEWKSHILVAMAAVAYKVHPDITQTLLFQSFQSQAPSICGMFALCALGILTQDMDLTEKMLIKLDPYKDNGAFTSDIAMFHSYSFFTQGQYLKSIRHLSGRIHCYPNLPTLWLLLALLLLHTHRAQPRNEVMSVATCAHIAMTLGQSMMNISKVMSLVSLSHLLSEKANEGLRSAQKAVHLFPDVPENWIVLIASYLPHCIANKSAKGMSWLKLIIGHVRRRLEASRPMVKWLSNYERMVTQMYEEYGKQ
ncbi:superkiller complex protein 3 [Hetaerina americana]|uniref:superkiller complex protein 3 n=1 Tax=Hetaerina americana TaxID=62018 RepID=UPI003A7F3523